MDVPEKSRVIAMVAAEAPSPNQCGLELHPSARGLSKIALIN